MRSSNLGMKKSINRRNRFTRRIFLSIGVVLLFSINSLSQNIIWQEDFTYADGTTVGSGSPAIASWTADGADGSARGVEVISNQLRGRNTRGPNPDLTTWEIDVSNPIELTGYTDIAISIDLSENSNLEAGDYIRTQYNLDEAGWVDFATNGYLANEFTSRVASQTGLNGSILRLRIIMYNNANTERYFADNIVVSGTATFYSSGNADPSNLNNWWTNTDGTGNHPSNFTTDDQTFIIQNGDTYTATTDWSISGTNSLLQVQNGGTLDCGGYALSGTADVTLNSGATILIGHANGINGNLQTSGTHTFNIGANYTYSGTTAQVTGSNLPTAVNNLAINNTNAGGVTLTNNLVVNGVLDLQQNPLAINGQTLTLDGTVVRTGLGTGTISGSNTSTIQVTGNGALGDLYFTAGSQTLLSFSVNRTSSGTIGLGTNLTVGTSASGTLTLTEGVIEPAANVLTVANVAQGAIAGGSATAFINGSLQRAFPTLTSGSSNYFFPIGENGNYRPLELIDVVTGITPSAIITVAPTGATNPDASIAPLLSERNWYVNGTDLTSAFVRITEDGMSATNSLGISTTAQSGPYLSAGGTGTTTITSSTAVTAFPAWFAIGTSNVKTFYSYQDGDWDNADTWTLDPSGTVKVGNTIPGDGDDVVILSGRTVTLTADVTNTDIDITIDAAGFLNLATYQFTNTLLSLNGQGTLQLASVNFPAATANTFINAGGGTTEYNNATNFTLPASQTEYNNLTINTLTGIIATQLSDLTLNGNLNVKQGTFRINDNSATTALTIDISGNVTVDNGAFITVGNGSTNTAIGGTGGTAPFLNYYTNFHTIIINGDFTNNGTVRFTNLTYPIYDAFPPIGSVATSGAATVYFQGSTNNTLTCNGITDFYNLILDKGVDQTYKLTINSSAYANFKLFGANTLAIDGAVVADPNMRKALWIRSGSLVLKGNSFIPSLTEGSSANSQYCIPSNGALIIDGIDVIVFTTSDDYREINTAYSVTAPDNATIGINTGSLYSSTFVFGKLQINNGYLSTRESRGLETASTGSGQLIINGGTIDAKQFLSATGSGSYSQVGGTLLLRGRLRRIPVDYSTVANLIDVSTASLNTVRAINGANSDYGTFNLENSTNVFTMSGGTIRIYDVCGIAGGQEEAFDVKSDIANINVTGGTLELIPTAGSGFADATNFLITSTATLGNLTINRTSSASIVQLNTYPLTLLGNLTLTSGDLSANNLDVTIGGNLTIESGTSYTPGTNTTSLNGTGNQIFTVNLATTPSLNNFTIDKPAGTDVTFAGSQNTINVNGDFNLTLATLNDNGNAINILGDVYNSGMHAGIGKIVLNGTNPQTISGNGTFGNLELNNTDGSTAPVSLTANTTINGELTFSQDKLFDINTYNLKLNASATIVNGGPNRYIQTAGNAGDGGLTKVYSSTSAFVFPIGAPTLNPVRAVKYTPASIGLSSAPTSYGSITINPVGYEHPATTNNDRSLTYYWRVKSNGFILGSATVTQSYSYSQNDVVGTGPGDPFDDGYVAARYDNASYTWTKGTVDDVDDVTNNIIGEPGSGNFLENVSFIDGDYTAGDDSPSDPFGALTIFYSLASANWDENTTWSNTGHTGLAATGTPGVNDIVIIGNGNTVSLTKNESCASLQIEEGSALDIYTYTGSVFSVVLNHTSGNNGLFRLTTPIGSPGLFSFPSNSDFSDFNNNRGTTEYYDIDGTVGALYILPSNVTSYGNLILTAKGGDNIVLPNNSLTTINGDLTCGGDNPDAWITMSWRTGGVYNPVVEKTIHVTGNMYINNGTFLFLDDEAPQHLIVDGDVTIAPTAIFDTYNNYPVNNGSAVRNNTFDIGGSLINNSNANPSARFIRTNNYVDLTFFGNTDASITSTGGSSPNTIFNNVTINKGNSQATTLTCNIEGTLTTPTNNWLTLQNGTFIYDRTGNFTISTTTDFVIPTTSGLTINTPSNVYIANTTNNDESLFLNGKLTISNGTVYVGQAGNTTNNADIEYSAGGYSEIEISGGELFVTGLIRRPLASTNGVIKYTQSGGDVFIYGNRTETTRAKLEIANTGSEFNMSNGTLTIIRGGGVDYGDLYLRPASSIVTGGEIIFTQEPITGPTVDSDQDYILDANIALHNLTITGKTSGTNRTSTLDLNINPLIVNGDLSLNTAGLTIFNSNNLNVTIGGDFANNGTYNYGTNQTRFNGDVQNITGSSVTNFYDLDVSPTSSLTVNNSFTVNRNLAINTGNLVLAANSLTLLGNLTNDGAYTDDNNTGGISLTGSTEQQIDGTGAYGRLELNNTMGARINNSVTIQNNLVMTSGVLDINQFQLTLSQNSSILGAPFNVNKMIRSDGVASSLGVRKFFPVISAPTTFTFPTGVLGKYTPADYSISASATVGSITVNPINTYHPTVIYADSVLQFYWEVESSGISSFSGALVLNYLDADVEGIESEYVAARLEIPGDYWYKAATGAATDNVDETLNTVTFNSSGSSNLSADYTAGSRTAIPDQVPSYRSNQDGDWSDQNIWTPIGTAPVCPPGGPNGAIVIIDHVVYTSTNYSSAYRTTINNELQIIAPTFGHNLGVVDGVDGTLYVETGNLPAGNYAEFLDCDANGTLNYGGTGSYTNIASLYNSVPNLVFSGTGSRTLYNKDLTICNSLVIDGPTLDNSVNNKKFTILGTMEIYNTGQFLSGAGDAPLATVTFAGTSAQNLGGPLGNFTGTNSFNNLEINNAAGLTIGASGAIEIKNDLLLTDGVITTSSTSTLTVDNTAIDAVVPTGGSTSSYISGPFTKQVVNGDDFIFPLGKGTDKGHDFTLTSAAGSSLFWTAEFFTPNATATSLNALLLSSNALEYWSVNTTTTADAKIEIAWDPSSNLTAEMTENGLSDMRVADWDGSNWNEIASTPSGALDNGSVVTTNNVSISTTPTNYTTASITITTPSARLSPSGAICGAAGIPVTFTAFNPISFPYTLDYEIDGVTQTTVVVSAEPYILPTPVEGAYQLTGFTYTDGGVQTGLVDDAIVNAYDVPTTANAGTDQDLCGVSGTTLDGNDPSPYSGVWSIINGTGGTLVDNNTMNTVFTGVLDETYTLRWTISNVDCSSSSDVQVTFDILPARPSDYSNALTPVCLESTGNLYTVPNDASVTYNWTYSGTGETINGTGNSVTIDFDAFATDGIVSVTAENGCGISAARTVSVTVNPRGSWVGDYSTDWFDERNWTCPGIPLSSSDVTIPSGSVYMPEIGSTGALCNNLTIEAGATLTLTGSSSLDVYGDFTNDDTFSASSTSTVTFSGTSLIDGSSDISFGNLTIDGNVTAPSFNMNIAGDFTVNGSFAHNSGSVSFNGGSAQTIDGAAGELVFYDLNINSGADVSVTAGSQITVANNTDITGDFTLESPADNGASASFIDNGITHSGTAHVQRHIISHQYHYITSPIQTPDIDAGSNAKSNLFTSFGTSYNGNFYSYDETVDLDGSVGTAPAGYDPNALSPGWTFVQRYAADPVIDMVNGQGYSFYTDLNGLRTFDGKLNTGDMSVSGLSYNENDPTSAPARFYDGWHLVGNPYPSCIDWDLISGGLTNLDNAIYVWDGANGHYASYVSGVGTNGQTNIVAAMQGFFVHANASGAGFTLSNTHRVHDAATTFKGAKAGPSEIIRLKVQTNDGRTDETVVYFNEYATESYDGSLDAYAKFSWNKITYPNYYNYEDIPNLYTIINDNNVAMSINALPETSKENKIIPVGLRLGTSGEINISKVDFNIYNTNVYFVDKLENRTIHLNTEDAYSFSFEKGDVKDRFELRFNLNNAPELVQSIENKAYNEAESFTFTIPANTFVENDLGDRIVSYFAKSADGSALPDWLTFNNETLGFNGTTQFDDAGVYAIKLYAYDIHGAAGEAEFQLTINNVNNSPTLTGTIPDQEVDVNTVYSYTIPDDVFYEPDTDDNLTLSAKLSNGNNLPEWLIFNADDKLIYGSSQNPGDFDIVITATDNYGASVNEEYRLTVKVSTTGFGDVEEGITIKLSPNPTRGLLFVEISEIDANSGITIRDYNGKTVLQQKVTSVSTELSLKELADGVYFVEILNGKISSVHKIILNK